MTRIASVRATRFPNSQQADAVFRLDVTPMARFNLDSPNAVKAACDPRCLPDWLNAEISAVESQPIRKLLSTICAELPGLVVWPSNAILLWQGCVRAYPAQQSSHKYPTEIKALAKSRGIDLDTRHNGPAIAAFYFAGGTRPIRFGSKNAWSIHHLYSGKFPHFNAGTTLHASKEGDHFTQSAGLVAVHPLADALGDEFPFVAWWLRAQAFIRFGYDPDHVFSSAHDALGFAPGYQPQTIYPA